METEGCRELVPVSVTSASSIADVVGAIPSHPDTAGLMGATLWAPIASFSQMLGSIGAAFYPYVTANVEFGIGLEAGSEIHPTRPPHPPLHVVDIPSGYPDTSGATTMGDSDTPDIADIYADFSVVLNPLGSATSVLCYFRVGY